tara:strand:+ start:67 stop:303 length:237 start_codon:yes stop_codon:yes gene_type:complete
MYEALEHWKQYKQEKELTDNSTKLVSEYDKVSFDEWMSESQQSKQLFEECGFQRKEKAKQEMSKFIKELAIKNGETKY